MHSCRTCGHITPIETYNCPNCPKTMTPLEEICKILDDEGVGDLIYHIRDNELLGWDGPRVCRWQRLCDLVKENKK